MESSPVDVYQFKVSLRGTEDSQQIWRRILVPAYYNFRNLHAAIQCAMGWHDYHLHNFKITNPRTRKQEIIGTPNEYLRVIPEETAMISDYFKSPNVKAFYLYDFGDGWMHDVVFESFVPAEVDAQYPKCTEGERACPPEDCGGIDGYEDLLRILADSNHEEHKERVEWLEGNGYENFDPAHFDPKSVRHDMVLWF